MTTAPELANEQPGGARIDSEVPVETLDGGVKQPGVDRLAVTHHQRGDASHALFDPVEDVCRGIRVGEIRLDRGDGRTLSARDWLITSAAPDSLPQLIRSS